MSAPVLSMERVTVALLRQGRLVTVLDDLDLRIGAGEMLALVGETGSGKTTAALSIPRLLPRGGVTTGRIALCGTELGQLDGVAIRALRGPGMAMVFQDPAAALNPSRTVGAQIAESIRLHTSASRAEAWAAAVARLEEVGIGDAERLAAAYPHQYSGGMRQRATIAMALACNPALLIADECTNGLDPIMAGQIMDLLAGLRQRRAMAILFVTHDLSLARRHADTMHVLYAGQCVERGPAPSVLSHPLHPYTAGLLAAAPRLTTAPGAAIPGLAPEPGRWPAGCRFASRCGHATAACSAAPPPWIAREAAAVRCLLAGDAPLPVRQLVLPAAQPDPMPLLEVHGLSVRYTPRFRGPAVTAVDRVSLTVFAGECLGIVGASGSGKTSLGRAVLQMLPYEGSLALLGRPLAGLTGTAKRDARRRMQVVFQDPASSLNPTMSVRALIEEPMRLGGIAAGERRERMRRLLSQVGLAETMQARLPGSLSGGQAQRVAVARALAAEPDLLVLDEPTSSLDVSSQTGLLTLLRDLLVARRMAYLFITHDLAAARFLSHRIAVMQGGRIVEVQEAAALVARPVQAASRTLVEASW